MNAGEMTDKELVTVSGEAEELLAGAGMRRSADVVGELRRRYLLLLAERSAAKMESEKVKVEGEGEGEGEGEQRRPCGKFREVGAAHSATIVYRPFEEFRHAIVAHLSRYDSSCYGEIFIDGERRPCCSVHVEGGMNKLRVVTRQAIRGLMSCLGKNARHSANKRAREASEK